MNFDAWWESTLIQRTQLLEEKNMSRDDMDTLELFARTAWRTMRDNTERLLREHMSQQYVVPNATSIMNMDVTTFMRKLDED